MRYAKTASVLTLGVVLAPLWIGCGSSEAQNESEATEQAREQAQGPGLLERLLEPETEPVVVPAGTLLVLRLQDSLSSHETPVGAAFSSEVVQEVSVDGRVAVPVGSVVRGHVVDARPAKKIGGRAILSLAFDEVETPQATAGISARLAETGKSEAAKDAAIIGGSTIGGAILGEAVDKGEGGTVGAIVGGIAGAVGALKTKGKPVELAAGSTLSITLESPVTLEAR